MQVKVKVDCCRPGCESSLEFWTNLSVELKKGWGDSYGPGELEASLTYSTYGEPEENGWKRSGFSLGDDAVLLCPKCK